MSAPPPVSIGMPVFNGEDFLAETITALLAQTAADFELIITDNGSTDATEAICRAFAKDDTRLKYFRYEENLGAAVNYSRCFSLSSSPLFKWAAHDDLCRPELLERSVSALRDHGDAVLAHSRVQSIDPKGEILKHWPSRPALAHSNPLARANDVLSRQDTFPIWGLMRRDVLANTGLLGSYAEHDRPLLYELALAGRFVEIDDFLFMDREHPGRSVRASDHRDPHTAVAWYDTRLQGRLVLPAWRLLGEFTAALRRSAIPPRQYAPYAVQLAGWAARHRSELVRDLGVAAERAPIVGSTASRLRSGTERVLWSNYVRRLLTDIDKTVPHGATIALIDEQFIDRDRLSNWIVKEFPDRKGLWDGLPASDQAACYALERQIVAGTDYLVFVAPCFWWFDHYRQFTSFVNGRYPLVSNSSRARIFALD